MCDPKEFIEKVAIEGISEKEGCSLVIAKKIFDLMLKVERSDLELEKLKKKHMKLIEAVRDWLSESFKRILESFEANND